MLRTLFTAHRCFETLVLGRWPWALIRISSLGWRLSFRR
jgi:hypothetical protein